MANHTSTGYGPRATRFNRLLFSGDETNFEQWEVKYLGYMRLQKLKDTIDAGEDVDIDEEKNAEAYAELIQFLDDKSLSLVMRDAADDGRKALQILREHYAGTSIPRIISLHTEFTSLIKRREECVTEYVIRAETAAAALRNAGETVSDSLVIAMIVKSLPDSFQSFVAVITQSEKKQSISEFKVALRSFEETEKSRQHSEDSILKSSHGPPTSTTTRWKHGAFSSSHTGNNPRPATGCRHDPGPTCYNCGKPGHLSRNCQQQKRMWCSFCKKNNHTDKACRFKNSLKIKDKVSQSAESTHRNSPEEHSFAYKANSRPSTTSDCGADLLVDCGATTHILNDMSKFSKFDHTFTPEKHTIELANGDRISVAEARGDANVKIKNSNGDSVDVILKDALFVPSFPQNIFSVQAATQNRGSISFEKDKAELVTEDKTMRFPILKQGKLYYLHSNVSNVDVDEVHLSQDKMSWHETLGHCNFDDVIKLENVVDGMKVVGKKTKRECETCVKGKMTNEINRSPRERVSTPLELVHTDLAGPITPNSHEGYKYAISFTDDFSGAMFVYFLKQKNKTVRATEQFLADCAPYGKVKTIRSDNGTEFTSEDFSSLLRKNNIKHERSAPYSPHQNGTAERQWRTIFEMGRCMLLDKKLPKELWPYAVHTAVYTRSRCLNSRVNRIPFEALTGRRPNISNMRIFGCECYAYTQQHKAKLDERGKKGVFVGYDRSSPANLVYFPDIRKVVNCRLVHFVSKDSDVNDNSNWWFSC